jgi:threonine dehydratase
MAISGAFKFRGACNAVFSLNDEDASKGVITHSRFVMCSNSIN